MRKERYPTIFISSIHYVKKNTLISQGLPTVVRAGDEPPEKIVAVIRPKAFNSGSSSDRFDQKFIIRQNIDMTLKIMFRFGQKNIGEHIYSKRVSPSSLKGLHGLYVFPVKSKVPQLFKKAGFIAFLFSLVSALHLRFIRFKHCPVMKK